MYQKMSITLAFLTFLWCSINSTIDYIPKLWGTKLVDMLNTAEYIMPLPPLNFQDLTLRDYFSNHHDLVSKVDEIFDDLPDGQKISQLLMPAMWDNALPYSEIERLSRDQKIWWIIALKWNYDNFKANISNLNNLNKELSSIPFLIWADAEPTLFNQKILGSTSVKSTQNLTSIYDVELESEKIAWDLNDIWINYNFAPVVDESSNVAVWYRWFGSKFNDDIVPYSRVFSDVMINNNILPTIKHFPWHGLVVWDSHSMLPFVDGELLELQNFKELIDRWALSVMVWHIWVKNNSKYDTEGLPASLSKNIVTNLLKDELWFKGLIITDRMNMTPVQSVPNPEIKAIMAWDDILLMPVDIDRVYDELLTEYRQNVEFSLRVDESVKKIIKMKIVMGLMDINN